MSDQQMIQALQQQVATLQARVAELEQSERELTIFKQITEVLPDGVVIWNLEGQLTYTNPSWDTIIAAPPGEQRLSMIDVMRDEDREQLGRLIEQIIVDGVYRGEWTYVRANGDTFPGQVSAFLIRDEQNQPKLIAAIMRDLSEQRQAEEERLALQEQVIDAQRVALREVSTPLIPLAEEVVVMPLVGAIDSARAQQIMEVLLEGIAHYQADTVLLDISGVRVVDTQVADALLRAARAVQLLGAQIILTGISADVAQTIVHLGADMGRIMTRANLQEGLRYALEEQVH